VQWFLLVPSAVAAVIAALAIFFHWASRRVIPAHMAWERAFLSDALGSGRSAEICLHRGVARAQGRAIACAFGDSVSGVIKRVSQAVAVSGNELLMETEADIAHLGLHYGMLVAVSDLLLSITKDATSSLHTLAKDDKSYEIGRRAWAVAMDIRELHLTVADKAKVLRDLLRELRRACPTGTIQPKHEDRIRWALCSVGTYLVARSHAWEKAPRDLAARLVTSLRGAWDVDAQGVQRECS